MFTEKRSWVKTSPEKLTNVLILLRNPPPCHAVKGLLKWNYPFYLKQLSVVLTQCERCVQFRGTLNQSLTLHPIQDCLHSVSDPEKQAGISPACLISALPCLHFIWMCCSGMVSAVVEIPDLRQQWEVNFGDGCVLGVIWECETHFCPHWEGEEDPMITLHSAIPTLSVWPGISLASPSEDVASPLLIPIIHDCRGDRDWVLKVNRVVYKTLIETGPCPKMLFIQIMFQSQFYPLTQDWL